jgi:flagellar hook-length control protein FliK
LSSCRPEADNRNLLELLAAGAAVNQSTGQNTGGMVDTRAEFMGLWNWLTSSQENTLNNPTASAWVNGNTLLAALLHTQQTVADVSGLNVDTVGTAGQDAATSLETIKLNEDLLAKMTIPSLPGESDPSDNAKLAENAKMAAAGKDASIPLWASVDPNSEKPLETPARQAIENSQLFKMTADAKPALEQSVNPNIVTGGVTTQPADHDSSIKSTALKAESLPITEFGGKINQIEGDNKDSSFFFAQDQMTGHLKALESATRTLEGARSGLTSQAMDQIVHKAVLLLNNDQQEVHLELKPEFLGHMRMQIVTEGQHVAIKITAEMPFVKDMLESNLNQLKAELQAQGLKIDSLEVSVGHDSNAEGDTHQATEIAKVQAIRNGLDFDDEWPEKPTQSQTQDGGSMAETAIDYFA